MKDLNIMTNNHSVFDPFAGPAIESVIHTTPSQAEIWIACQLGGDDASRAYNESISLILKGNLDKNAVLKALKSLVARHEALRQLFKRVSIWRCSLYF